MALIWLSTSAICSVRLTQSPHCRPPIIDLWHRLVKFSLGAAFGDNRMTPTTSETVCSDMKQNDCDVFFSVMRTVKLKLWIFNKWMQSFQVTLDAVDIRNYYVSRYEKHGELFMRWKDTQSRLRSDFEHFLCLPCWVWSSLKFVRDSTKVNSIFSIEFDCSPAVEKFSLFDERKTSIANCKQARRVKTWGFRFFGGFVFLEIKDAFINSQMKKCLPFCMRHESDDGKVG